MTRIADGLKLGAPILALVLAGFALAWLFVDPAPPSTITLATGEPGGAYASFGEAYRDVLANYEIELQLRETVGTAENLALLRAGEVEVGFGQGGVASADDAARLQSLGSLYRWYKELRAIDPSSRHDLGVDRALAEVARIEEEVAHVNAPDSYAEELFSLRLHIDFVRNRLLELRGAKSRRRPPSARAASQNGMRDRARQS